jgi:hypothetical protein
MTNTKQIYIKLLIGIFTLPLFSSINLQCMSTDDVAQELFATLQTMSTITQEEFSEKFIKLSALKMIANDKDLSIKENVRERLLNITEDMLSKRNSEIYFGLIRAGKDFRIQWESIEFVSFESKLDPVDKLEHYGKMLFKSKELKFEVRFSSITNGTDYFLADIESIRESP